MTPIGLSRSATLDGIELEHWTPSDQNTGRDHTRTLDAIKLEQLDGIVRIRSGMIQDRTATSILTCLLAENEVVPIQEANCLGQAMMKQFLLPAFAIGVLAGSAKAEDPSTATAWTCTSPTSGSAKYVLNGNELKKRDDDFERHEACRRKHPAPTPGLDGKISADAFFTDPCEPLDLQSYTFHVVSNNQYGLIAVSPEVGERDDGSISVAGRMIIIDKLTGLYVETLLSPPRLSHSPERKKQSQSDAGISLAGYGGTCDAIAVGDPKSTVGGPDDSHNADAVVEQENKPMKKNETRKVHVYVHRPNHHYKHAYRHNHHRH